MEGAAAPAARLVGRDAELGTLTDQLDGAAAGRAVMVLVSGPAGVGKTALVAQACALERARAQVLVGACLPLASMSVPFLPLRHALGGGQLAGELVGIIEAGPADRVPVAVDAWLARRAADRPVVLVADDLQWADASTLDLLMYVLAGPPDRRLAVVLTLRSGELTDGSPLHAWLADAARMPRFTTLDLAPLDRLGTAEQIRGILGVPPRESLVTDVFARSRGNPFFTGLLVRGLPPDAARLPAEVPHQVTAAALRRWHQLSEPARELARLLAVGGGPTTAGVLQAAADVAGLGADVPPPLHEAVRAGMVTAADDGRYWFSHPLQAEALEQSVPPDLRRHWHAVWASVLQHAGAAAASEVGRVVAVADHHFRAGAAASAYSWALAAADAAEAAGGGTESLRLLQRALDLHLRLAAPAQTRRELLLRARALAERLGKQAEELAVVDQLLTEVTGPAADPLLRAELLVRRADLRLSLGEELADLPTLRQAVEISAVAPRSRQHARALAQLAHAEMWRQDPAGPDHARAAVVLARAVDHPQTLSYALTALVMAAALADEPAEELGREAAAAALQAGDGWAYAHAVMWTANSAEISSSPAYAEQLRQARERLEAAGGAAAYVGLLSAVEAASLLQVGQWRACQDRLRVALGTAPGPMAEVTARLVAAHLAALQGRVAEAAGHLHRADELFAQHTEFRSFPFDAVRAQVALAAGQPDRALAAALTGLRSPGVPPTLCDRLLPLAARALADLAQARRDAGASPEAVVAQGRSLRAELPRIVPDGPPTPFYRDQVHALQCLYNAEVLRALDAPGQAEAWARAARACATGWCPWEGAYAAWRAAEACLLDPARQREGRGWLREAFAQARALDAAPLLAEVRSLARLAHVDLDAEPATAGTPATPTAPREPTLPTGPSTETDARAAVIPGLTARERDVLGLLVAGRTYAEIAGALFISEKTVSTHVSHLLRKTQTRNRVELARLAQRRAGAA
ncbi:AAA family ATPase [Georgenia sp. TF02-10]|uniref:helix-turn-helix transcriptional regulator n=1 Tax=Georgenia sp. TF02-10 TaxID=2917725 RepID=UPI001FA718B6|nr:LuxR family transcriptional regulator [Georgenia sp. TF02-10]UNX55023.1 AAA family ATPase [Georgenia sp. TF02-10]